MTTKAEVYGSKLCERVELLQANLLSSISSTINDFPENEVLPRYFCLFFVMWLFPIALILLSKMF